MATARQPFIVRLLPSLGDFAFLAPAAILFGRLGGIYTLLSDCDTGWHIRTGEWILKNHKVPTFDFFSFSMPGQPWFAWEWLSEVVMAWINGLGGLRAITFATILLISLTFALLYRVIKRRSNPIVAIMVTVVAAGAASIHWLARPHIFTFFFLVLFQEALERVREGKTHLGRLPYLALLPVVTILWTNLHGGFFIGIFMIVVYGAGEALRILFTPGLMTNRTEWTKSGRYFASAAACGVASLINPYTYHLHVHIAKYLRDPYNFEHIGEFLSPNFHLPHLVFFEIMVVLGAAAAYWSVSKRRFIEPLFLIAWAHASVLAVRNVAIFQIIAAPAVGVAIQEWLDHASQWNLAGWLRKALESFRRVAAETAETEAVPRFRLLSIAAMALIAMILWAPNPPKKFRAEWNPDRYPVKALPTIQNDARIFAHDEWGDYLVWSGRKVFVDGRSDFYGDDFENKYIDVMGVKPGWDDTLNKYGVNTILTSPQEPLSGALKESSRWHLVYDDGQAVIFRSAESEGANKVSVAAAGGGAGRDREVTKTESGDRAITQHKQPKT